MAKYQQQRPVAAPLSTDKTLQEFSSVIQGNLQDLWEHSHDHEANGTDVAVETGDRVVVSDSDGLIESSDITTTELESLDNITSNIQTQIDGKQATGNYITALTGDISASGPGSAVSTLAIVNGNIGSFIKANITVNDKGLITAASNGNTGYVEANQAYTNFPSSTVWGDLTSINLTTGTWDISVHVNVIPNGASLTTWAVGISSNSGTSTTGLTVGNSGLRSIALSGATQDFGGIASYRVVLGSNTTYYLKYSATYTGSTPQMGGRISAVQV